MKRLVGRVRDNYRLDELIGEGARGATFKAYDLEQAREVAVKFLDPKFAAQPELEQPFQTWLNTAARLEHPDIIEIFDINVSKAGVPNYIVMELIPTGNLRQYRPTPTLYEAIHILRQICLILDFAHRNQIFHRALKPENILLAAPAKGTAFPRPFLADLGLPAWTDLGSKKMLFLEPSTDIDVLPGTLQYLAPEQLQEEAADARSDVYALGIILYELATRRVPFEVKTISQAQRQHGEIPPAPPRQYRPNLPEALEQIILKALAKNPEDRFQSAEALAEALANVTLERTLTPANEIPTPRPRASAPTPPAKSAATPRQVRAEPTAEDPSRPPTPPVGRTIPSNPISVSTPTVISTPQAELVKVEYNPAGFLFVTPGQRTPFAFTLTNLTEATRSFNFSIDGIPSEWLPDLPRQIKLGPNRHQEIRFAVEPPRAPSSQMGRHNLIIRVHSADMPGRQVIVKKPLTLSRFTQFSCQLLPEKGRIDGGSQGQVAISNEGNGSETFLVRWHEATGKVRFKPGRERLQIPAGQMRTISFQAAPNQLLAIGSRPLIQNLERHPFSVAVSLDEQSQTLAGEVLTRGLVPARFGAHVVILALLVAICFLTSRLIALKPIVENIVLNPFDPAINQPFMVTWVIGGNTWGASVDLAVDSELIKTDLDIGDEYTFLEGLSKPYTLTVEATNIFGLSDSKAIDIGLLPPEVTLTVSQEVIRVGDPVLVAWRVDNASSANLAPFGPLKREEFSGSREDRPRQSLTYILTAADSLGRVAVAEKRVEVLSRDFPAVQLTIQPPVVTAGQDQLITLTWKASNADTVIIEPDVGQVAPCNLPAVPNCNPIRIQAPAKDIIFIITGKNEAHTISETVELFVVDVADPAITEFTVEPAIVTTDINRTVTLSWQTRRADVVTLDPNVGLVGPSGFQVLEAPTVDTTYALTAKNTRGASIVKTVKVKVRQVEPPLISFAANPTTVTISREQIDTKPTLPVTLEWDIENVDDGDQVTISRGGQEIVKGILAGSTEDKIPAIPGTKVTYVLTARNRFDQVGAKEVTVSVQLAQ